MRRVVVTIAAMLACAMLAACEGDQELSAGQDDLLGTFNLYAENFEQPASSGESRAAPPPSEPDEHASDQAALLAYSYDTTLRLPGAAVGDVLARHRDACQAAGPRTCQVLLAQVSGEADYARGTLRFRAVPAYVASFRDGLAAQAEAAGGLILADSQEIENLTRAILDARARLAAQETLRERLVVLLERQDGSVSDLLAVERELARVQGEIESMRANLRALEGRVSMNTVTVLYEPRPVAFEGRQAQPLREAVTGFFGVLAESLAALIVFLAAALPWLVIGVPVVWLLLRLARRVVRGRRRA